MVRRSSGVRIRSAPRVEKRQVLSRHEDADGPRGARRAINEAARLKGQHHVVNSGRRHQEEFPQVASAGGRR